MATLSYHASPDGESWLSIATRGDGRGSFVRTVKPRWAPGEVARGFVRARIRISALDRLGGVELRLSDTASFERFLTFDIPFYQDTTFNRLRSGEWTTVSFPFAQAQWEGDPNLERLAHCGWFVHDRGTGGIVVDIGRVELVPRPAGGIVSFTFDDGYGNQLRAAEILSPAGFAATAYVIPKYIGEGAFLAAEQLRRLADEHGWEIAAHDAEPFTEYAREGLEEEVAHIFDVLGGPRLLGLGATSGVSDG